MYICYMKNEQLIKSLKNTLTQSEQMWIEEKSHAYIVGYFQGYIKSLINELLDEYND